MSVSAAEWVDGGGRLRAKCAAGRRRTIGGILASCGGDAALAVGHGAIQGAYMVTATCSFRPPGGIGAATVGDYAQNYRMLGR